MWASATPVTRFMAPGPDVAMQTPTCGVSVERDARDNPCAMNVAPCSWRGITNVNSLKFSISSNTGMIAPPV